jgi:hypothetical protein
MNLPLVVALSELGTRPDQLESIGGPTGVTVPQPLLATVAVEADPIIHNRFIDGVRNPDLGISILVDRRYDLQGFHALCCVSPVNRRPKHRCSIARLRQQPPSELGTRLIIDALTSTDPDSHLHGNLRPSASPHRTRARQAIAALA